LIFAVLGNMAQASPQWTIIGLIGMAIGTLVSWVNLALGAKRWQDTDRSGWFCLFVFVPFLNLITIIVYGFSRGTVGANRHGSDPLDADAWAETKETVPTES